MHGILLAAGESRRMGYVKPLLPIGPRTFVAHLAALMLKWVPRLVVVVGAEAARVRAALPPDSRIVTVENRDYASGQLASLKVGLAALGDVADAALVHLADHPLVQAATFGKLVQAYARAGWPIAIARHRGRRGHPIIFARSLFVELMWAPESEGARAVVNRDPSRVCYVEVDDPGVTLDLDTPEDLARAGLAPPAALGGPRTG